MRIVEVIVNAGVGFQDKELSRCKFKTSLLGCWRPGTFSELDSEFLAASLKTVVDFKRNACKALVSKIQRPDQCKLEALGTPWILAWSKSTPSRGETMKFEMLSVASRVFFDRLALIDLLRSQ